VDIIAVKLPSPADANEPRLAIIFEKTSDLLSDQMAKLRQCRG